MRRKLIVGATTLLLVSVVTVPLSSSGPRTTAEATQPAPTALPLPGPIALLSHPRAARATDVSRRETLGWKTTVSAISSQGHENARKHEASTSFEGHVDLPVFAIVALSVDRGDVAPYVPAGFRTVDVGGKTTIFVGLALFENTSVDFNNGTSRRYPEQFAYSDLAMATYGPDGSSPDAGGLLYVWRHAAAPIFPNAMARLGVDCGGAHPPQTRVCHLPRLTVGVQTSLAETRTEANVPWGFSPYSVSASFLRTALPCAVCLPIPAWHSGSRGFVREDGVFSNFPDSAIIGVGTGSVRASPGSPLFHILGGRERASGQAVLFRVHIDAEFTLLDRSP